MDIDSIAIPDNFENRPLIELIDFIEDNHTVRFFFDREWINDVKVVTNQSPKLVDVLRYSLSAHELSYTHFNTYYLFIHPDNFNIEDIQGASEANLFMVSGKIEDGQNDEALPGVYITVDELEVSTTSGYDGSYRLDLPLGVWTVNFKAVGLQPETYILRVFKDQNFNVSLFESITQLREVVITDYRPQENLHSVSMGVHQLNAKVLKSIPPL